MIIANDETGYTSTSINEGGTTTANGFIVFSNRIHGKYDINKYSGAYEITYAMVYL